MTNVPSCGLTLSGCATRWPLNEGVITSIYLFYVYTQPHVFILILCPLVSICTNYYENGIQREMTEDASQYLLAADDCSLTLD